jgi:predicted DNA-binding protein
MRRYKSYSISMPAEMAEAIDAYCARTEISKSCYVVKLLQAGMKVNEVERYSIPATIRSTA